MQIGLKQVLVHVNNSYKNLDKTHDLIFLAIHYNVVILSMISNIGCSYHCSEFYLHFKCNVLIKLFL